jgi:hypothetical protein
MSQMKFITEGESQGIIAWAEFTALRVGSNCVKQIIANTKEPLGISCSLEFQ